MDGVGPRIVIAGGSGFIGSALAKSLENSGIEVVLLSRKAAPAADRRSVPWDGETLGGWADVLDGAKCVVNLSGTSVSARKTDANRRQIIASRVRTTELIGDAVRCCARPPSTWINASATGFYGSRGDEALTETSRSGNDFLADVCKRWEGAVWQAETPGVRKCVLRSGIVLGREGGAYPLLLRLVKAFVGGAAGSGRQWMPWIHLTDQVNAVRWLIDSDLDGAFNVCSPNPVRNSEFMRSLRTSQNRPFAPPAPAPMLRLLSQFLPTDLTLALDSCRAMPKKLVEAGFEFEFQELQAALADLKL
jgi:uncharacterized protein (TIGR01777 family)